MWLRAALDDTPSVLPDISPSRGEISLVLVVLNRIKNGGKDVARDLPP
jgi:hypothetical protein